MDDAQITRMEHSFKLLAPRGQALVERFYVELFARHGELRPLFPQNLVDQQAKLLTTLVVLVDSLRKLDRLTPELQALGARHALYGVQRAHYPIVRDALLAAMAYHVGDVWTQQLHDDWSHVLDHVSAIMLSGANATS